MPRWFRPAPALAGAWLAWLVIAGPARAVEPVGDTLTVIQRPILNVPAIVRPGDQLTIECAADQSASGWTAGLRRGQSMIPLQVLNSAYYASTLWWQVRVQIPPVAVYELYDLVVTARGGISDTTRNAVRVIPGFKTDYYFIQITDTHMPTHYFYPDGRTATDSSEIVDFREIIKDVNIINPEFVVLTGDLINEGELEDFLQRQYFTKAQRLLAEFEVPVYLTGGNHDLGGWGSTPPPAGTARRTWWRFFGWKRLDDPPAGAPARTQDYSFDYGPVHYVGLEAYNNYDGWRYETYGSDSFTQSQMDWLASDLAAASASTARVLFYHYDFTDQINLNSLGAAMALAGHTHTDQNDFTPPYDIVTRSACDGNRAYRLIRVSGGAPVPTATLSAGSSGKALDVTYEPANDGSSTSLTAHVANGTGQRFEHGLLRFVLPNVTGLVDVTGGTLSQVDRSGPHAVCYVEVDIGASGTQDVTINLDTTDLEAPTVTLASPNGGEVWEIGSTHDITWTATDNVGVAGVTLVFSSDGGATYVDTLAVSEPNDGIYTWAVDAGATSAARIRAVAYDVDGNAGSDGSNGDFEVTGGGADKPAHLVIAGAAPNPFNRQAVIRFGLPAHETAEIKLYEVSGRLVGTLVRAPYDAGYHTFDWTSSSSLGAGIYILRLEAGAESAACKVVIPR